MSEWIPPSSFSPGFPVARPCRWAPVPVARRQHADQFRAAPVRSPYVHGIVPRVKRGPIEIQPLFIGETESVRRTRAQDADQDRGRAHHAAAPVGNSSRGKERKLTKASSIPASSPRRISFDREEAEPDIYTPPAYTPPSHTEPQSYSPPSYAPLRSLHHDAGPEEDQFTSRSRNSRLSRTSSPRRSPPRMKTSAAFPHALRHLVRQPGRRARRLGTAVGP